MTHVVACIDGSQSTPAVCDYSVWASQQLSAPLMLLHVLDSSRYPVVADVTGTIGLGSREFLLEELAELDEKRSKLALQQGHHLLEAAQSRAATADVESISLRQRHGDLAQTLVEMEAETRLVVMGLRGEESSAANASPKHVGSQLETVLRTTRRPVLLTPTDFTAPRNLMIAFDGSETAQSVVKAVAQSPLFKGLPIHVVMVDADTAINQEKLTAAVTQLQEQGFNAVAAMLSGDIEPALHQYQREQNIDILVMGAYGHSRIRQFLLGSTTTNMLNNSDSPLLILR